ncbi:hypothetical protein BC830DRAFT_786419 [Chytriomyces sp. MP71]|nr:hypothetical protein BC830DRAFT_786419 [Chytriomyces sp. MP71]
MSFGEWSWLRRRRRRQDEDSKSDGEGGGGTALPSSDEDAAEEDEATTDYDSEVAVTDDDGLDDGQSQNGDTFNREGEPSVVSTNPSTAASVTRRAKKFSLSMYLQKTHLWLDSHADTVTVAVLIPLVLFGGAGLFMLTEGWDYLDSLYFNYSLITTTGYGDIYPASGWGRTLVIVMIFVGLGLWAYAVSTIVARLQAGKVNVMARHIHAERAARKRLSQTRNREKKETKRLENDSENPGDCVRCGWQPKAPEKQRRNQHGTSLLETEGH